VAWYTFYLLLKRSRIYTRSLALVSYLLYLYNLLYIYPDIILKLLILTLLVEVHELKETT